MDVCNDWSESEHVQGSATAGCPSEIWGRIATWLAPCDFMRFIRCKSSILVPREQRRLWHYFCHTEGFARPAEQGQASDSSGFESNFCTSVVSQWWAGPEVDWQRSFQMNALAQASTRRHVFACVRVRDEDLRIPAEADDGDDSKQCATTAWLFDHGWRPRSTLSRCLRQMLEPCEVPLRFRELCAGRPGMIIRRARFFAGTGSASALAEWPIGRQADGAWCWQIPPHTPEEEIAAHQWEDSPAVRSGPHPWGRGYGWLVELEVEAGQQERIRIFGISSPASRWVVIGSNRIAGKITLREACREVQTHLMSLGFSECFEVLPACMHHWSVERQVRPSALLLTDLRWTQGERLRLKEVSVPRCVCLDLEGSSPDDPDGQQNVVLFQRVTARQVPKRDSSKLRVFLKSLRSQSPLERPAKEPRTMPIIYPPCSPSSSSSHRSIRKSPVSVPRTSFSSTLRRSDNIPEADFRNANRSCDATCCGWLPFPSCSLPSAMKRQDADEDFDQVWQRRGWDADEEEVTLDKDTQLPHSHRLLLSSSGSRQFEFHPSRSGTLLAGRKDGVVAILDHEVDTTTHVLEVDSYPILGLSWLHTNPQWAVVGVSQSGTTCLIRYDEAKPGHMESVRLESFSNLSSLSVNCTDEYFMTSGFCVDLGLYDIVTGRKLTTFRGMHQNFINILRFAHRSPHVFATASFDHTCKVWDLRQPSTPLQPVRVFQTDTLNVMCSFSPDDENVLCSGVDDSLLQFSLAKHADPAGSRFPLPAVGSITNYRRSLYLSDGDVVATAATNESLLRLCMAASPHNHLGYIDFKGSLTRRRQYAQTRASATRFNENLLDLATGPIVSSPVAATEPQPSEEYVQSLRCHPTDSSLLGVLLSTSDPHPESYISMLRLGQERSSSRRVTGI